MAVAIAEEGEGNEVGGAGWLRSVNIPVNPADENTPGGTFAYVTFLSETYCKAKNGLFRMGE